MVIVRYLLTLAIAGIVLYVALKIVTRPFKRVYYALKSVFRGKYFHKHYIDEYGQLKIVYRTDFGLRFWTLMGRLYSVAVFLVPLFFLMVRLNGTEGYALAGNDYAVGDTVMIYNVSEFRSEIGVLVSEGDKLIIENNAEAVECGGFVIGKYYAEPLTVTSVPGLFVRSVVANVKIAMQLVVDRFTN